jgi:hypothetical protein
MRWALPVTRHYTLADCADQSSVWVIVERSRLNWITVTFGYWHIAGQSLRMAVQTNYVVVCPESNDSPTRNTSHHG